MTTALSRYEERQIQHKVMKGEIDHTERTRIVGKMEDEAKDYLRVKYHYFLCPHTRPKYPQRPKEP